ncbi:type II toxin-antitoxin system VapC family toxin [Oxynema aestuarii AP17]|uniref:Type II toxin-antitoxin system VapC family toxin n=2 Tax=Oxynema TaxID=1492710 RepID=A0A6H1U674_9CYAN|nr:type II toxin-antitoxin system VapC family toxin [Oxynema aestuarii AP17]
MVIDTSAIAAILFDEPERADFISKNQVDFAALAWRNYGKGRHPAGLNCGDCFAYALAKATGEPLLFKGADFSQTDIAMC